MNGLPNLPGESKYSYHYKAFDWGPTIGNDETVMKDHITAEWAAEQLRMRTFEKPFFMAIGFSKPHLCWYVPQKYFDMYPLDEIELPKTIANDLGEIIQPKGDWAFFGTGSTNGKAQGSGRAISLTSSEMISMYLFPS